MCADSSFAAGRPWMHLGYPPRRPTVSAILIFTITPPVPGVRLFYTTEAGKDPVREGIRYTGPFFVGEKKTLDVRAAARDGNLDSAPAHTRFTIEDNHNGFRPAAAIFSAAAPEQSIAPDSSGKVRVKCPSPRFCIDSASVTPVPGTRYFYTIDDSTPLINTAGERLTSSTRELDALGVCRVWALPEDF